ncbi:putative quinol monooxygenase [Neptunitalea lumnitzerae]|uniref:Antibiotic biosynthesis monooxygenase n=1 Tax=Neptunitalea lumnitzerae TaxID=2965509 RepID=A0ABQ5MIG2_9FLAO|nr:antibiotic biosynthesis monooxygenase family protein [Neptunitalea sp. Y10]GLB49204.1 antibiotic biosynthesis monooxygenase [Neptunitalea sp. Y10]
MFIRIVKLTFQPEKIEDFKAFFEEKKSFIRSFEGCEYLELYQDKNNPQIFFTYSYWTEEAALENYRNSDLFKGVWKITKSWFSNKAEAWSVDKLVSLA